jgi:hypothetical protein
VIQSTFLTTDKSIKQNLEESFFGTWQAILPTESKSIISVLKYSKPNQYNANPHGIMRRKKSFIWPKLPYSHYLFNKALCSRNQKQNSVFFSQALYKMLLEDNNINLLLNKKLLFSFYVEGNKNVSPQTKAEIKVWGREDICTESICMSILKSK